MPSAPGRLSAALAVVAAGLLAAGCNAPGGPGSAAARSGHVAVVAGENTWGNLAAQIAGNRATVRSIIVNPATDPHSYQPSAADARTIAGAQLAIVNGIGYDRWMSQALAASPAAGRAVLDTGTVLGLKEGDNPHQWYAPRSVDRVTDAIAAALIRLDPAGRGYYMARLKRLRGDAFARYDALRAEIRRRYAGTAVGCSENIFVPLAQDLELRVLTPASYTKAVAEGTELTVADRETVDRQARTRAIKVWVLNSQNETPDVQRATDAAQSAGISVTAVTETLSPAGASFEAWQVAELARLAAALHRATGR